jgi:hypothetical protein
VTGPIDNMAIALTRIAEEAERRTGTLDLSNLGLQSLPEALFDLRHLRELDLGNHKPWEPGTKPNQIDAQRKRLECLASLEVLSVRWSDLSSLDLVRSLQNLEQLDCSGTPVTDLTPLAGLSAVKRLDCSGTRVTDLTPLAGLSALKRLDCGVTQVTDLTPLAGLSALQQLDCRTTKVTDLTPLAGLSALQRLNCRSTKVTDLTPLAGLSALQQLDCSETRVTDLTPLAGLSALQELDCSKCRLQNLPPSIFTKPSLKRLVLYASHVPGVPPTGILSQKYYEDCLDRVRAHFADLAMGSEVIVDIRMRPLAVERSTPAIETLEKPSMDFRQEKPVMQEWYVSYAWGDDKTPEGKAREQIVDDLCASALASGHQILRDKEVLGLGDSISRFMRRIGTGDRIFVILNDKYLRSPHCMFELSEIWRTSRHEGETFLERARIYALPETKIWDPIDWTDWAIHWKKQHDALDSRAKEHGAAILGEHGHRRLLQMQCFYTQVPDILGTLADIVQPRTFEDLKRYGFNDLPV